ncbi:MAG: DUF4369 domain-containing protein [Flavobacteriaceae bacterium]|nr:DUF4369 domain-containing protein [Flavobacteriaceae bacterium]
MKIKYTLLLLSVFLFLGCQHTKQPIDGFTVKGDINGLGNSKILIIKFVDNGMELDSIFPENDSFTYSGKVKEPYFIQMLVSTSDSTTNKLTEFMIENSEISVTGNTVDYDSVKVSGSKSDRILKEYFKEDESLNARWNELKLEYDQAVASNDSVQRKTLAKELNKIFKVDRVGLLKKYVADHANTTVGALIPAFCTIEDALTTEDYREIYNMLSDSIKISGYGQNILEKFSAESE